MKPLRDIRVCDLTQNLAGPFCTQVLGDLGAEVIKVEPPGGDSARGWGPPFWGRDSTLFLSANRNKRSLVLDLKRDEGRRILHRLASTCDVLVQSARPGVAERLGYDYETIRALRQDVIHVSISAYGETGPLREMPGYDPLMQAFAGIMSVTGHPDGPPARVGGSVVDFGTGMWTVVAILGALRERDRTGRGARLEAALMDTALVWVSYHLMGYLASGEVPGRMGSAMSSIAPYQMFPTADGHVMIAAGSDTLFARLCGALGLDDVADDPRFRTNPDRAAHREELAALLSARTRELGTEALTERMYAHGVPCSPIQDVARVSRHPQVEAAGMLPETPHPEVPEYRDVSLPLRMDGERPRGDAPPPATGQHTGSILQELGFSEEGVRELMERGVVEGAPDARMAEDASASD